MADPERPEWLSQDSKTVSPERQAELDAWKQEIQADLFD
jgi:hypothetical protein